MFNIGKLDPDVVSGAVEDGAIGLKLKNGEVIVSAVPEGLNESWDPREYISKPFSLLMMPDGIALTVWVPIRREDWDRPIHVSLDVAVAFRLPEPILAEYFQRSGAKKVLAPTKRLLVS